MEWLTRGFPDLLAAVSETGRKAQRSELNERRAVGIRAAEQDIPLQDLIDAHLRVFEESWAGLPGLRDAPTASDVRRRGSAVLGAVRQVVAALSEGYESARRLALQHDEELRREFVEELLRGRGDLGRLADRAERLGVRLAASHAVAVVTFETGIADELPHRLDVAMSERFGSHNVLVVAHEGRLVIVSSSGLRGVSGELSHRLIAALGADARWRIGVGRAHAGPGGVVQSYDEAVDAIDLAERLGYGATIVHADDLLVFRVLLRDREAMIDLVTTVLSPLRNVRGGVEPLLETLSAFFECQGNITATARRLQMSPRAVAYRLDRVAESTGYSATEPTQRFTLEAAVLGAKLLEWPKA